MKAQLNKERASVSYQSNFFDIFIQYYFDIKTILFNNRIKGLFLMKTTYYYDSGKINNGYGLFLDFCLLGFRFGIYITLIELKK